MRTILLIAAIGLLAWSTPVAWAQGAIPQEVIIASRPLTQADRDRIDQFVSPRLTQIRSGTALEVSRARNELAQPPRTPGASDIFRRAYADSVRAGLRPLFTDADEYRASNALSVLPFLLTAESLDELAENASLQRQRREAVRIMAARLLAVAARNLAAPNPPFTFNPVQADSFVRKIREAALEETSWIALAELGTAAAEVGNWRNLPDANRDNARVELLRILQRATELAKSDASGDSMRAVQRTLADVQRQLLEMRGTTRAAFGQQLAPILKSIRTLAASVPDGASPATRRSFEMTGKNVDLIERILADR